MLNEKGIIRMSIFTKSILITYLCMVGASLGHGETVGQSQKVSSTNYLFQPQLPEGQLDEIMSLIVTNLLPLFELNIEAECLWVARFMHNCPTDTKRIEMLENHGLTKQKINNFCRDYIKVFFGGKEDALDELIHVRSYVERRRESVVTGWYGSPCDGSHPAVISYESALKNAGPSRRIDHAILSSHFKAVMYAEVADILREQLEGKDKERLIIGSLSNAMKLIELDKKSVPKPVPSDGDKK
jgi:hypothetical protein